MKVWCVIIETADGTELAGVYSSLSLATGYVKQRFQEEYQSCIDDGYRMIENVTYTAPSNGGAEVYLNTTDYWLWKIESAEVINGLL